jgi:hypothetical protein
MRAWWVAAAVLGASFAARAADPLDWAPEETQITVVCRDVNVLADLVDKVDARFGQVPNVKRAVERLRAWTAGGARPAARQWGPGLRLERGVGLFVTGHDKGRLVLGADDAATALETIATHLRALDMPAQATPDGLTVEGDELKCALREGFLVCQDEAVPEKAPGAPSWSKGARVATDGLLLVRMEAESLRELTGGAPFFQDLLVSVKAEGDALEAVADLAASPMAADTLGMLAASGGPVKVLSLVDETSRAILKISLDPQALFGRLEAMSGGPPPAFRAAWDALRNHWSGDLVLTADGGLTHPVLLVGLTTPAGGEALLGALSDAASHDELQVRPTANPTRPDLRALEVKGKGDEVRFDLPYAVVGNALVMAASPADVERRVQGKVRPMAGVDPTFAERGASGLRMSGVSSGLSVPWLAELFQLQSDGAWLMDLQVVLSVIAELTDDVGIWVRPRADGLRARFWWRLL